MTIHGHQAMTQVALCLRHVDSVLLHFTDLFVCPGSASVTRTLGLAA